MLQKPRPGSPPREAPQKSPRAFPELFQSSPRTLPELSQSSPRALPARPCKSWSVTRPPGFEKNVVKFSGYSACFSLYFKGSMDFDTFREPPKNLRAPSSKSGVQAAPAGSRGTLRGLSQSSPRTPESAPRSLPEFSQNSPKALREFSQNSPRVLLEPPRALRELSQKSPRSLPELSESCPRALRELSQKSPRSLREPCESFPRALRELSQKSPRTLRELCESSRKRSSGFVPRIFRPWVTKSVISPHPYPILNIFSAVSPINIFGLDSKVPFFFNKV